MWSLVTLTALSVLTPPAVGSGEDAPPPSGLIACTPAEQSLAGRLRSARSERTLDDPALPRELAALGLPILRPCLDALERERVAQVAPGDRVQILSIPQREVVLDVLAELPHGPVLEAALERGQLSSSLAVRRLALDVIGAVGSTQNLDALVALSLIEGETWPPRDVQASFQAALVKLLEREPKFYERLGAFHRDAPEALGDAIVCAVGDAGDPRGLAFLEHVLTFRPGATAMCASQVRRLGRSGEPTLDRGLAQRLRWAVDPDRPETCRALLLALGELRDYDSVPLLIGLLDSEDPGLSGNALWALRRITELEFPGLSSRWQAWYEAELAWFQSEEEHALRDLHVGPPSAAAAAARAISERRLWREDLALELLAALERPLPSLRAPLCRALERLGVKSVALGLVDLLDDDPDSAAAALHALVALTGRDLPADATTWRLALAMDS
jgi:HEAT repeat protein